MIVNIRKAVLNDVESLSQLFDSYRIFYRKNSNINEAKYFLTQRIENNESEIFIAENEEGVLSGFVQFYILFFLPLI
ncbi:hypothetical protein [Marinigracilibium pacificum]|uniref:hypothetical protein n=1 Tax=Marinigracilibium pacificum TaxID=2729599 RepID=UPI00232A4497|nr:hypothetical protein [Marinigracilibium pacificum]